MPEITTDALTHRAAALVDEVAMATREVWSTKRIAELAAIRVAVLDELHSRAYADHVDRSVRRLEDRTLQNMLVLAELIDQSAPRTAIAIRVVREELHRRAYLVDGVWRCNCHAAANVRPARDARHGRGCACCGAGVS